MLFAFFSFIPIEFEKGENIKTKMNNILDISDIFHKNKYKMVVAKEITVMMEKVINAKNPKRPV